MPIPMCHQNSCANAMCTWFGLLMRRPDIHSNPHVFKVTIYGCSFGCRSVCRRLATGWLFLEPTEEFSTQRAEDWHMACAEEDASLGIAIVP